MDDTTDATTTMLPSKQVPATATFPCPFCGDDVDIEITVDLQYDRRERMTTASWASIDANYGHPCTPTKGSA